MVKPGYKQTEIGVIPKDWKIKYLSHFGNVISGGTPSTSVKEYWDGDIAWCTPSDITATPGKYIYKTERNITIQGLKNCAATILPPYSVLLCTRATIGELKISKVPIATNQGFKNLSTNSSGNIDYLYYLLQAKKKDMLELAIGSTFLEISKTALCHIPLQTPPLDEQERIAEALSDVDELIFSLEKMIEKYKSIKATCLQQMFPQKGETTPKMRLPGFTGAWEQRKLGEISKRVIVGLATSVTPYYRESGTPILRNLNIKENYLDDKEILFLDKAYAESQVSKQIHTGDVLTVHTGYIGTSCIVPEKYDKCLTFTTLITTTDATILKGEYLAQYLNSEIGMNAVQAVTTQGGRQNLNTNDFVKVEIRYPSLSEQNAICKTLQNLDNLITLHQRKLDKAKNIKQGMMQQLLTGKIRLV